MATAAVMHVDLSLRSATPTPSSHLHRPSATSQRSPMLRHLTGWRSTRTRTRDGGRCWPVEHSRASERALQQSWASSSATARASEAGIHAERASALWPITRQAFQLPAGHREDAGIGKPRRAGSSTLELDRDGRYQEPGLRAPPSSWRRRRPQSRPLPLEATARYRTQCSSRCVRSDSASRATAQARARCARPAPCAVTPPLGSRSGFWRHVARSTEPAVTWPSPSGQRAENKELRWSYRRRRQELDGPLTAVSELPGHGPGSLSTQLVAFLPGPHRAGTVPLRRPLLHGRLRSRRLRCTRSRRNGWPKTAPRRRHALDPAAQGRPACAENVPVARSTPNEGFAASACPHGRGNCLGDEYDGCYLRRGL